MASKYVLFTLPMILKFMCMRIPSSVVKKSDTQSLSPMDSDFLGLGWGCFFYTHFKFTLWVLRWLRNHTLRNTRMWLYPWPRHLLSICSHAGRGNSITGSGMLILLCFLVLETLRSGWLSATPVALVPGMGRNKYMSSAWASGSAEEKLKGPGVLQNFSAVHYGQKC